MPRGTGKPFRPFLDMIYHGIPDASWKSDDKTMEALVSGRGEARLFLGHYAEEDIIEVFGRYSIQDTLERLGLEKYRITMDASNPDAQELKVHLVQEGADARHLADREKALIAEVILREAVLAPNEALDKHAKSCPYLVIQWICLQNPLASFDPKDLLPGQRFPGLGAGQKVLRMFEALINRLHLEGIVNRPEFLHNALMYSRVFEFVNPEVQGRLKALKRQLGHLNLWQVAWAAEKGYVVEDGVRRRFRWYQSEQVWANCESMVRFFESSFYQDRLKETEERARYELSDDTPDELSRPMPPRSPEG
jgi:hypothetical protein